MKFFNNPIIKFLWWDTPKYAKNKGGFFGEKEV